MTVMRLAEKEEKLLMHKLVDCKEVYDLCIKEKRKKVNYLQINVIRVFLLKEKH